MHELAATKGIVEIVRSECEKSGIIAPHDIYLELGQLTPYVGDCLKFYFEVLRDEEGWPKARLHIKVVKGMVKCRSCGKRSNLKDGLFLFCQKCESTDVEIVQGRGFKIAKITGE